jgi:high-affinity nickel-transport protein
MLLGFALGMRHAFDPDHVVAMGTIVTRERGLRRAALLGGAWGAGHCLSLFAIGLAVLLFRVPMSPAWGTVMERLVGVMLVVLGIASFLGRPARPAADLSPGPVEGRPTRGRPFAVGLVHGLAGSGALAVAVLATIPSRAEGVLYMALFAAGAVGGMMLITALFAIPMRAAARARAKTGMWIPTAASLASVAFGFYYLYRGA